MNTDLLLAGCLGLVAVSALALRLLLDEDSWLSRAIDKATTDTSEVLT